MNEFSNEPGETRLSGPLDPTPPVPPASGDLVLRRTVKIRNARGLHARAAAKLAALAERYSSCINVVRAGQSVPACSIMGLMMLGAGIGSEVTVEAEGWDAKEALDAVAGLVEAGFHED